jgi:23S rRNA (guanosine2251-2'-O)-methyltransferase
MNKFRQPPRPRKSSLIAGRESVLAALAGGEPLDRIYVSTKLKGKELQEVKLRAAQRQVPVSTVPEAKLNSFNVTGHEGWLALKARITYQQVQEVVDSVVETGRAPLLLILDGITDIRNIGAIARTAYCMGVDAIIIPDKGVGALQEDAMLTSAGALEKIAVCRVNSLMKTVDELHLNGIRVFATEMKASNSIRESDFRLPAAIVMGSEERGVNPALLKICDERVHIPMGREFESLNVSVATAMILYEVMTQRNEGQ